MFCEQNSANNKALEINHIEIEPPEKNNKSKQKSIFWDTFTDLALGPFATPILTMQAAHPDVGAAVAQYSVFKSDPWGRLFRTGFSMVRFLHPGRHGQTAKNEIRDLRKLHAHIKGKHSDGSSYFALEPQTFRVVPDTFLDGIIRYRNAIGRPLNEVEKTQVYEEYLVLCENFGIKRSELECDLQAFYSYYDNLLLKVMTYNETVEYLLTEMMLTGPEVKFLPKRLWQYIYSRVFSPIIRLFTIGFLDPRFRKLHNIAWSEDDERKYQIGLKWIQRFTRYAPRFLRYHPFSLYVMAGGHGTKTMDFISLQALKEKGD